jgi:hypothetical protein
MTVHALLRSLEISPESVLVTIGDELVTRDARVDDAASVEIRPVSLAETERTTRHARRRTSSGVDRVAGRSGRHRHAGIPESTELRDS